METVQERLKESICLINPEGKRRNNGRNNSIKLEEKISQAKEMHKPLDWKDPSEVK